MKVIFLDIDGVLNHENWFKKRMTIKNDFNSKEWNDHYPFYEFDPESVKQLNKIIDKTGAKVVISSTWRHGRTVEQLQEILDKVGFIGEVIDKTPSFIARGTDNLGEKISYTIPRGCEIDWWLESKGFQRINWSKEKQLEFLEKSKVKNYIILDDDSDMLYGQREHFVKTNWKDGLNDIQTNLSIEILNKTLINLYYESDIFG
jgi:hypothetical protein